MLLAAVAAAAAGDANDAGDAGDAPGDTDADSDLIGNQDVRILVHDIEQVRLEERMMTSDDRQVLLTRDSSSCKGGQF